MKDLGELRWILGMEVKRERKRRVLHLNQEKYIQDMLVTFQMDEAYEVKCPVATDSRLSSEFSPKETGDKSDPKYTDITAYRTIVGKLVYAMVGTRPDIAFAVSQCSRFFSNPGKAHLRAAKHILRYLKGTSSVGLTFGQNTPRDKLNPYAFCDSDWAQCLDTRRSTSGYVVMLNGAAVSWISKRMRSTEM